MSTFLFALAALLLVAAGLIAFAAWMLSGGGR